MLQVLEEIRRSVEGVTDITDPGEPISPTDLRLVAKLGDSPEDADLKRLFTVLRATADERARLLGEFRQRGGVEPTQELVESVSRVEVLKSLFFWALDARCATHRVNIGIRSGFRVVTQGNCSDCASREECLAAAPSERPGDYEGRDWLSGDEDRVEPLGESVFTGLGVLLDGIQTEVDAVGEADLYMPPKEVEDGETVLGSLGEDNGDLKRLFTLFHRTRERADAKRPRSKGLFQVAPGISAAVISSSDDLAALFGLASGGAASEPEEDGPECADALNAKAELLKELFFAELRFRFQATRAGISINNGWIVTQQG